jgi:hypothetical protein
MGMVLRFPVERARTAPVEIFDNEPAEILILPMVRIVRDGAPEDDPVQNASSGSGNPAGSRRRRRAPRD